MSKLKKLYPVLLFVNIAAPLMASAQGPGQKHLDNIIQAVGGTINIIMGGLFVLATVVFLWGVVMFIAKAGDPTARDKAKGIMTWGIIGLAVMAAAWGITRILVEYFDIGNVGPTFRKPPVKFP